MPCELCMKELKTGLAVCYVLIGGRRCYVCGYHKMMLQYLFR